jgi:hypothetical protein
MVPLYFFDAINFLGIHFLKKPHSLTPCLQDFFFIFRTPATGLIFTKIHFFKSELFQFFRLICVKICHTR